MLLKKLLPWFTVFQICGSDFRSGQSPGMQHLKVLFLGYLNWNSFPPLKRGDYNKLLLILSLTDQSDGVWSELEFCSISVWMNWVWDEEVLTLAQFSLNIFVVLVLVLVHWKFGSSVIIFFSDDFSSLAMIHFPIDSFSDNWNNLAQFWVNHFGFKYEITFVWIWFNSNTTGINFEVKVVIQDKPSHWISAPQIWSLG